LRLGLRLGLGFRWLRPAILVAGGLGCRLGSGAFEVRGIPAAPLELEPGGGDELAQGRLAAGWTRQEQGVGELLQCFQLMPAGRAAIFIDRHDSYLKRREGIDPKQLSIAESGAFPEAC